LGERTCYPSIKRVRLAAGKPESRTENETRATAHPEDSERLPDLTPREPIYAIPNFSYRVQNYTGKGFLCIGDSHRFIDPILPTASTLESKKANSPPKRLPGISPVRSNRMATRLPISSDSAMRAKMSSKMSSACSGNIRSRSSVS
jgi:hypothetical protein